MSLNLSFTAWTAGGEVREESLSVFSDEGMSSVSQTSFGHISINSSLILTVSMATESP